MLTRPNDRLPPYRSFGVLLGLLACAGFVLCSTSLIFSIRAYARLTAGNVVINQLFGVGTGLGMGILTFDWAQITYVFSPLIMPWWAQANMFAGFICAYWIIAPALYYSNVRPFDHLLARAQSLIEIVRAREQVFETAFLPVSVMTVFDRFGQPYNASRVLDVSGQSLDRAAYADYSPVYMPIAFVVAYGAQFMVLVAIIVDAALHRRKEIWERLRSRPTAEDIDIHVELMQGYPRVPSWAYLALLLAAFGLSAALVSVRLRSFQADDVFSEHHVHTGLADGSPCLGTGHCDRSRAPLLCALRFHLRDDIDHRAYRPLCW